MGFFTLPPDLDTPSTQVLLELQSITVSTQSILQFKGNPTDQSEMIGEHELLFATSDYYTFLKITQM